MIKVIPAERVHCDQLAPILREMDKFELSASMPIYNTYQQLITCYKISDSTFSVMDDELGCIAMFGVRESSGSVGVPWMLSSSYFMDNHSRRFMKECRFYLENMTKMYSRLFNYISTENYVCIRWLEWLGFTIHKDRSFYVGDKPFYLFTKEK
jgi:hypothetical protein